VSRFRIPTLGRHAAWLWAIGLAAVVLGLFCAFRARKGDRTPPAEDRAEQLRAAATIWKPQDIPARSSVSEYAPRPPRTPPPKEIESLCSSCHLLPTPDVEPKLLWPDKIRQMYQFMRGPRPIPANRMPPIEKVIAYWTSQAPEQLELPDDVVGSPPSPLKFIPRYVTMEAIPGAPAIANIKMVRLGPAAPPQLLFTDMRWGLVILWTPTRPPETAQMIGRTPHPCRTFVVDLDKDGLPDILVANVGVFSAADTDEGTVEWLHNRGNGRWEQVTLAKGLGRVADVQAADFDGTGKISLVVADFGHITTGRLLYLENVTTDWRRPEFEAISLDGHTGTSDVKVTDINGDGLPDFVALQSQESEHVFAMLNRGGGSFYQQTIYRAPHPRWGSTGIVLCDLNGDGKIDVLFNHGDSVDFPTVLRPYHGLSWLENKGTFPFTYHRLAHFPGAHTSVPADLDGDGRLDVVSTAFIPTVRPSDPGLFWPRNSCDSVIWLRQTEPGRFQRYGIETNAPFHPCAEAADIDGDGDVDIVVGNFSMFPRREDIPSPCFTIFENTRLSPPSKR
jgi:hypothetical protein